MESSKVRHRILEQKDIKFWIESKGYHDYMRFIKQLNEFAKDFKNNEVSEEVLIKVIGILDKLSLICDKIEPFHNDGRQR